MGSRLMKNMEPPGVAEALNYLSDRFGVTANEVKGVSFASAVNEPGVYVVSVLAEKLEPEQLRERASRLLATANRLEQERAGAERPSFDAFTPAPNLEREAAEHITAVTGLPVYLPPGEEPEHQPLPPDCGHMGCHLQYDQTGDRLCTYPVRSAEQ